MRPTFPMAMIPLLLAAFLGCSDGTAAPAAAEAAPRAGAATTGGEGGATPAGAEGPVLDRAALRGDGCTVLDDEDVAAVVGVDASQVSENAQVDCLFSWPGGSAIVNALRAHRDVEGARRHYARFTEDVTAEEMREGKTELQDELREEAASGGELDEAEAEVGVELVARLPEDAVTNRDVPGVGSEASTDDRGTITVRFGNVTFDAAAKRGDEVDRELTIELARRVVGNLDRL